ncbi:hypothetical protein PMIT1306_01006 [Prochlorococcus sp. MIT 1306]|nr:hypothetical protein PMIT1306_01006 [Prochlorococcus sp. MIT 1306]
MLPEAESTQDPSSFFGNFGVDLYGFLSKARMVQP